MLEWEVWGELRAPKGLSRETRRKGVAEFPRTDKK